MKTPKATRGISRRPTPKLDPDAFVNAARGENHADVLDALAPAEQVPASPTVTFNLRFTADQHRKLSEIAEATGRSKHEVCMTILLPGLEQAHGRFVTNL